jgi:hypothetical protein
VSGALIARGAAARRVSPGTRGVACGTVAGGPVRDRCTAQIVARDASGGVRRSRTVAWHLAAPRRALTRVVQQQHHRVAQIIEGRASKGGAAPARLHQDRQTRTSREAALLLLLLTDSNEPEGEKEGEKREGGGEGGEREGGSRRTQTSPPLHPASSPPHPASSPPHPASSPRARRRTCARHQSLPCRRRPPSSAAKRAGGSSADAGAEGAEGAEEAEGAEGARQSCAGGAGGSGPDASPGALTRTLSCADASPAVRAHVSLCRPAGGSGAGPAAGGRGEPPVAGPVRGGRTCSGRPAGMPWARRWTG